jgi:ribonuclease-3
LNKLEKLSQSLGYHFQNNLLLEAALSHRSVGNQNYERLEFLGDSILSFVIASELFKRYPKAKEGELSRLRASLVNGEMLASLAKEFKVGECLRLGIGELKSGGIHRQSILADAMEAIIGAIYLDSDLMTCQSRILQWFTNRLENLPAFSVLKDPKTKLQEYLQAQRMHLPEYKILSTEGEAHAQTFYVECVVIGFPHTSHGSGPSRRKAEQQAAIEMLELITALKKRKQ